MPKKKDPNIHSGHRERIRKRYIDHGLDNFEDHQVLELLLFYCIPMRDTNELAHRLIKEYGNISLLFDAHPLDLVKRCNISESTAVLISMIPSLSKLYSIKKWGEKVMLDSTNKAGEYITKLFLDKLVETLYIICLNTQHCVIHTEVMSEGNYVETPLYPRKFIDAALKVGAVKVIIAHNHPSGDISPSKADINATTALKEAFKAVEIDLIDHIIVGGPKFYSFMVHKKM